MSITILEALQNADYNLQHKGGQFAFKIGKEQLHNAVILLFKGYSLNELIDPLLEKYCDIEDIPDKNNHE